MINITDHINSTCRDRPKEKEYNIKKNKIRKYAKQKDDSFRIICLWGQLQSTIISLTSKNFLLACSRDTAKKKYQHIIKRQKKFVIIGIKISSILI